MSEKKRCVIVGGADIGDYARVKQYLRAADAIVFSPDGRQVAWMEDVEGFRQLWVTETGR